MYFEPRNSLWWGCVVWGSFCRSTVRIAPPSRRPRDDAVDGACSPWVDNATDQVQHPSIILNLLFSPSLYIFLTPPFSLGVLASYIHHPLLQENTTNSQHVGTAQPYWQSIQIQNNNRISNSSQNPPSWKTHFLAHRAPQTPPSLRQICRTRQRCTHSLHPDDRQPFREEREPLTLSRYPRTRGE
jgi:hypothetical protein